MGILPGAKVTPEIAKIRGKNEGEDIISPSNFPEIQGKEDLKDMVSMLEKSEGRPIGIKIAAGRIEEDLEYCLYVDLILSQLMVVVELLVLVLN